MFIVRQQTKASLLYFTLEEQERRQIYNNFFSFIYEVVCLTHVLSKIAISRSYHLYKQYHLRGQIRCLK